MAPDAAPPPGGIFCSIVVPCYNEEGNVRPLVREFAAFIPPDMELVMVDNGSSDSTAAALRGLAAEFPFVRVVSVPVNRGYGCGITRGLEAARGRYAGWTHGDLQYSPAEILSAAGRLRSGGGEKMFLKGLRSARPLGDTFFTAGMSVIESLLFGRILRDINAQPVLFHRSLLDNWTGAPEDFSLDLYAYAMAKKLGFRVLRVPMTLRERAHGRSSWNRGPGDRFRLVFRTMKSSLKVRLAVNASGRNTAGR